MRKITLFLLSLFLVIVGVNGQDDLVAHYDFNDGSGTTLTDLSGNGHHGIITGGTWSEGTLQIEPAEEFVDLSEIDDASFALSEYTIHVKVKFNEIPQAWTQIYTHGDAAHTNDMALTIDGDNHVNFITHSKLNGNDFVSWFPGTTVIGKDEWYDIAVTCNAKDSVGTIYLNGAVEAVFENFVPITAGVAAKTTLGIDFGGWGPDGNIVYDDLKVYNRALSQKELYPSFTPMPNLVAHYNFDGGTDTILNDVSGNGHEGAIVGGTWSETTLQVEPAEEYIILSNADDATFSLAEYTIQVRVKFNEVPQAWTQIYTHGEPTHANSMVLAVDGDNHLNFITHSKTNGNNFDSWFPGTTVITKDEWYDIAVTCNATDSVATMYLNGEVEAVFENFVPIVAGIASKTVLGIDYGGWGADGSIVYDDLKVYDGPLTFEQLYPLDYYLVAHYDFGDGSDTIVSDVSGNGHDGALVGGTWTGDSLQIEPAEEYVILSKTDDPTFALSEYTISVKVKFNELPQPWTQIFSHGDVEKTNTITLAIDGDNHINLIQRSNLNGNTFTSWFPSKAVIGKDEWYDISITCNAKDSTASMYLNGVVDGVQEDFVPITAGIPALTSLGIDFSGWGADANMVYDDLKVYNKALTDRQIMEQYYGEVYEIKTTIAGYGEVVQVSPAEFSGLYPVGTEVTLAAVPTEGFGFLGWSGDVKSIEDTIMITMDADFDLTATFSQGVVYYLDMKVAGHGAVTPESGNFSENAKVELVATPDEGYSFVGWTGDFVSELATDTIVMDMDKSVVATFEKIKYQLTVTLAGTGSGTVTPENGMYSGSQFLSATADAGSEFMGWTGDTEGAGSVIAIQMDGPKNVTATFDLISGVSDRSMLKFAASNYPNPFTGMTTISYTIDENSSVSLRIYDALGRELDVLVNAAQNAGTYTVNFDGSNLAAGTYFYQLKSNSKSMTNKMLISK